MPLVKHVRQGELLPAFYGVAWVDFVSHTAVCLPVGLNILAAVIRATYTWARYGYRAMHTNPRDAYWQGYRDGKRNRWSATDDPGRRA